MKKSFIRFISLLAFYQTAFAQTATFKGEIIDDKISIGYGVTTGDVDGDG